MQLNWRKTIAGLFLSALAAAAAGAENGVTDSTILIGQTIGLTGTVAAPVKEMNEGAKAYFDSVNRQGGVNGRKIELRILDDGFVPARTAANAEKLIKQDHVFALFQTRGTPHTEAVLPILAGSGVPLVAPSTGAVIFHAPVNRLIFNVRAKYQDEVIKGIEHFTTLGYQKIGLLHVDDSFGRDGLAGFVRGMAERKLEPTIIASFARDKPDVAATAAELIKANPKALIIVSSSKNTVDVIKAIRAQGGTMQLMTLSNNSSESFVKDLGPAGVGLIMSQITPAADLVSSILGQEFKLAAKASGATMSYAAMDGFVSAKVLVEGLRRAGPTLTRDSFIRGLESIRQVDLGGLMVSYSAQDHTGSEFVELTMIGRNGRLVR
jgi:ABC-type branched-subunit amino acid transport system substrate-binding protein